MQFRFLFILLAGLSLLTGCDPNGVMEKNVDVKDYKWTYNDSKVFNVNIKDTSARYNIYINVRHSFFFEWRNMYVNIETILPDSSKLSKRVNLPLAEGDGKWFGNCVGETCDMQVAIQQQAKFPQRGNYTFKITQDMRVSPLPNIKNIGLRVEKSTTSQQSQ